MNSPTRHSVQISLTAALLMAGLSASAQSGTWTNLASGSWSAAANWNNAIIASGADSTADFSTLDITGDVTVTLDGTRTIGNLSFGDTSASHNWILNTGTGGPLTLSVGSGFPTLTATSGSNSIGAVLASQLTSAGLTKLGNGTLRLGAANLLTNINANINAGTLLLGNNNALGYVNASVGSNVVANGATLRIPAGVQAASQRLYIAGAGVGGTNGALRADAGTGAQQNTRWSFALNSAANPAIILTGDATVRVDGSGYTTQAGFLVGAVTNNTSDLAYTLTLTGTGEFRVDPAAEIAVANIDIQGGVLGLNGNGPNNITRTQVVSVASAGAIGCRRNHAYNTSGSFLTLNGVLDLNYNQGATANTAGNTWFQRVGALQGSGAITNSSLAPQTLYVSSGTSNSIFGGTVNPGTNGPITFRKEGQDTTMWLTGSSTFSGTNIVAGGIVYINGAWNPTNGGFIVSAQSGATTATLAGKGSTVSEIALGSGGLVSAGDPTSGGGTLSVKTISTSGGGDVIVSNANLSVSGSIGSSSSYVNSLYATNGTLTLPLLPGGASVFAGTVTVDGKLTLAYTSGNPSIGQFPLIAYSSLGGLVGGDTNGITLISPAGTTAYLSNNAASSTLDVVITAIPALVWKGNVNGNWDIGGTANWLSGATSSAYTEIAGQGPFVIFDDTATGTSSVNVSANVAPKGITVNSDSKNYTFSGSGQIGGNGGIVKSGSSTLTFANTNSLSGSILINSGAVSVGNGGTSGDVGSAAVVNNSQLIFNRSGDVTFANAISGTGSLDKQGGGTVTLSGIGDIGSAITVNGGTLALAPAGTITVSGDVTGAGAFGVSGAGTVVLNSGNVSYSGGTIVSNGTLQLNAAFPPSGNIADYGTLAIGVSGTLANNISGAGGVSLVNAASVTLSGANTYTGPTRVLGGSSLYATPANYPANSALVLGSINGTADTGSATFSSGNVVVGGLVAGGNSSSPGDPISLSDANQTLTVNGSVYVGNTGPSGASVYLPVTGTGATLTVNTNGGVIQLGLATTGSGVNPDNIFVDLSGIDNFVANLGATGLINLGTTDGSPGPSAGATVVNWFNLAAVSNNITAGTINIGAGGRQLVPEFRLGAGTNILNVSTLALGLGQSTGGRDGGYLYFSGGTGGLRLRGNDGVSRAAFSVGSNPVTGTGASITNTVDFTGHPVDLLVSTLVIGNYNNAGVYQNTFSFDTGTLDAQSTSLSVLRNNNGNAAFSGSTLNINGGTASLGPVSLTTSVAYGTLSVNNATLSTANIVAPGAGVSMLSIANSTWNLALTNSGNPTTAAVFAKNFSASGTINLNVTGTAWTAGQFPLIGYTGSIGGDGYSALNLVSLPAGVSGHLSNNVSNLSVDLVITSAPSVINPNPTNITTTVSGNQITLSWPASHIGWLLQSNSVSLANTGAWATVAGSGSTNQFTYSIDSTKTNVFFRMLKP
jgi:fibronectin-binding autotransporter adhesin